MDGCQDFERQLSNGLMQVVTLMKSMILNCHFRLGRNLGRDKLDSLLTCRLV